MQKKAEIDVPGLAKNSLVLKFKFIRLLFRQYMEPCFAFGSTNTFPVVLFRHVGSRVSKPHGYPGDIVCLGGCI